LSCKTARAEHGQQQETQQQQDMTHQRHDTPTTSVLLNRFDTAVALLVLHVRGRQASLMARSQVTSRPAQCNFFARQQVLETCQPHPTTDWVLSSDIQVDEAGQACVAAMSWAQSA
jgi:hypothetical protein